MPEYRVQYTRHIEQTHIVYVEAPDEQTVADMYDNGEIDEDSDAIETIMDETLDKLELVEKDPDVQRDEQQDQSREAVLKLGEIDDETKAYWRELEEERKRTHAEEKLKLGTTLRVVDLDNDKD